MHSRKVQKVYDEAVQKVGKDFVTDYIYSGEPFVVISTK